MNRGISLLNKIFIHVLNGDRPAKQSVRFADRRRHFCRQEGCQKNAL